MFYFRFLTLDISMNIIKKDFTFWDEEALF